MCIFVLIYKVYVNSRPSNVVTLRYSRYVHPILHPKYNCVIFHLLLTTVHFPTRSSLARVWPSTCFWLHAHWCPDRQRRCRRWCRRHYCCCHRCRHLRYCCRSYSFCGGPWHRRNNRPEWDPAADIRPTTQTTQTLAVPPPMLPHYPSHRQMWSLTARRSPPPLATRWLATCSTTLSMCDCDAGVADDDVADGDAVDGAVDELNAVAAMAAGAMPDCGAAADGVSEAAHLPAMWWPLGRHCCQ